ncbi:unnamed protein product [Closterium sp. NIES-54]
MLYRSDSIDPLLNKPFYPNGFPTSAASTRSSHRPVATHHLRSRAVEQHSRQAGEPPDSRAARAAQQPSGPSPCAARAARAVQQPSCQRRPSRPSRRAALRQRCLYSC